MSNFAIQNTSPKNKPASNTSTPVSLPICFMGTRPMNIITKITPKSSTAVERFSSPMSSVAGTTSHSTYFMAVGSAPLSSSRCMALSICAAVSTIVPLAISEGWKVNPGNCITRLAPLMLSPHSSTHSSVA